MEVNGIQNLKLGLYENKLILFSEVTSTQNLDLGNPFLCVDFGEYKHTNIIHCNSIIKSENAMISYKISTNEEIERFFQNSEIISPLNLSYYSQQSQCFSDFVSNLEVKSKIQNSYILLTFIKVLHECSANLKNSILLSIDSSNGLIPFSAAVFGANRINISDQITKNADYLRLFLSYTNFRNMHVMDGDMDYTAKTADYNVIVCDTLCNRFLKDDTLMRFIRAKNNSAKNCLLFPCACDVNVVAFTGSDKHNFKFVAKDLISPVVGRIDYEKIIARSVPHNINFATLKNNNVIEIQIPFTFTMTTECDLQGIALWFDFIFECPGNKYVFSTSPQQKLPQWDQKIYLLPSSETVRKNETISGKIKFVLANSVYTSKLEINKSVANNSTKIPAPFENKSAIKNYMPEQENQSTSLYKSLKNLVFGSEKKSDYDKNVWSLSLQRNVKQSKAFIFCDTDLKFTEKLKFMSGFKKLETTSGKINVSMHDFEDAFQINDVMTIIINDNYSFKEIYTKTICSSRITQCLLRAKELYVSDIQSYIKNGVLCTEKCKISETKVIKYFQDQVLCEKKSKINKYIRLIKKILTLLNNYYEEANKIITDYKQNWRKKFESWQYMTNKDFTKFNNSVKQPFIAKIIAIKNREVKCFLKAYWNDILTEYIKLNDKNYFEAQFNNIFIKQSETFVIKRVTELSKCGVFSRNEIKTIFEKVLDQFKLKLKHFISTNRLEDITESQVAKLEESVQKKFFDHDLPIICESYERTINLLNKARKDSYKKYTSEMESKLVAKVVDDNQELHKKCKALALEFHNQQTKEIKQFFEQNAFEKINSNNVMYLENSIKLMADNCKFESENLNNASSLPKSESINTVAESTLYESQTFPKYLAIYYGLKEIICGYYRDGVNISNMKTGDSFNENSIALNNNKFYFGFENDAEYKKLKLNPNNSRLYSIQELLVGKLKTFSTAELKQYRLKCKIDDYLSQANNIKLSMESLIALQILKAKQEAEEELQQNLSNLVFTIPPYFGLNEINLLNNIAKLIDLQPITYLSEINALAIQFFYINRNMATNEIKLVFIIVVNELKFDAVLCLISKDHIQHISYTHISLSNAYTRKTAVETLFSNITTENETKSIINKAFNLPKNTTKVIDNVLIGGYSQYKESITQMAREKFNQNTITILNDVDFINGAVLYSHIISSGIECRISEIARETVEIEFRNKWWSLIDSNIIIRKNHKSFDINKEFNIIDLKFPIEIIINQKNDSVLRYKIPEQKSICMHNFVVRLISNEIIEIDYTIDKKFKRSIDDYKVNIDGKNASLLEEKRIIESFGKKLKEHRIAFKKSQQKLSIKNELNNMYDQLKNLVENSDKISRVKKLSFKETLDNASKVLNSDESKTEDYVKQIECLKSLFLFINK